MLGWYYEFNSPEAGRETFDKLLMNIPFLASWDGDLDGPSDSIIQFFRTGCESIGTCPHSGLVPSYK